MREELVFRSGGVATEPEYLKVALLLTERRRTTSWPSRQRTDRIAIGTLAHLAIDRRDVRFEVSLLARTQLKRVVHYGSARPA